MPRFNLLLPVIISTVVSTLIFYLTRQGFVYGPANLLVAPLVIFLPGGLLTTGMIELASMHILSGSARLIYGAAMLMLLFIGIAIGLNLSNLPSYQVYSYRGVDFPWWAPFLGTLLFGLGTFVRLSGANRDLFWMLLVLYIAMLAQSFGEQFFNSYVGAFLAATLMALSSEIIARSPRRTPAVVSQVLAFWFLVPGARGLLSVTSLLSEDVQSAAIALGQMAILIVAITLGVLLGTLLISPQKFVPVTADRGPARKDSVKEYANHNPVHHPCTFDPHHDLRPGADDHFPKVHPEPWKRSKGLPWMTRRWPSTWLHRSAARLFRSMRKGLRIRRPSSSSTRCWRRPIRWSTRS